VEHTNECIAGSGGREDDHLHGGPLRAVRGHPGHLLQEDAGSRLLGMQQAQDEVQHSCTLGGRKEQRKERRRVRGAATTDEEVMGLLRRLVGVLERGAEGLWKRWRATTRRWTSHRLLALLLTIYRPLLTGHCAQYQ